jgi:hypothetical protein
MRDPTSECAGINVSDGRSVDVPVAPERSSADRWPGLAKNGAGSEPFWRKTALIMMRRLVATAPMSESESTGRRDALAHKRSPIDAMNPAWPTARATILRLLLRLSRTFLHPKIIARGAIKPGREIDRLRRPRMTGHNGHSLMRLLFPRASELAIERQADFGATSQAKTRSARSRSVRRARSDGAEALPARRRCPKSAVR